MEYDPQVIKEITPCSKRKNHASIRARDESAEAVSARITVFGGDEDCLAPLQLRPCSSLVFFGRRAGVIYYLLVELASDFEAMIRNYFVTQTLLHPLPSRYQQPHSLPQASHHSLH